MTPPGPTRDHATRCAQAAHLWHLQRRGPKKFFLQRRSVTLSVNINC